MATVCPLVTMVGSVLPTFLTTPLAPSLFSLACNFTGEFVASVCISACDEVGVDSVDVFKDGTVWGTALFWDTVRTCRAICSYRICSEVMVFFCHKINNSTI